MLGLGRAMGETIAVALVIGAATQITPNIFASGNALPAIIVQNWGESGRHLPGRADRLRRGAVRDHGHHQLRRPDRRAAGRDPHEGSGGMTTVTAPAPHRRGPGRPAAGVAVAAPAVDRRRRPRSPIWRLAADRGHPAGAGDRTTSSYKGAQVMSWEFLTERIPRQPRPRAAAWGRPSSARSSSPASPRSSPSRSACSARSTSTSTASRRLLARTIRTMADVMTGVPSIVMGLFIFIGFVLLIGEKNGLAGALALACLMLPVVIRTSEEMLRLVPDELRQASLALGARKWRTTRHRGAAGRDLRHHQRRAAGHRPGRRRDRADRARGRHHLPAELEPVRRRTPRCRRRSTATPPQPFDAAVRPGLGRRAHAGRDRAASRR